MRRFLRKLIKPLFFILFIALAIQGSFSVWNSAALRSLKASLLSENDTADQSLMASFVHDADGDGLSNAKEIIFGTDGLNTDTDHDGYKDGDEIKNGYDPTLSGNARIEDNIALMTNLTVAYFIWEAKKTGDTDPRLNEDEIDAFLAERDLAAFKAPTISDQEIILSPNNGVEAVKNYLNEFSQIQLPAETASYLDVAQSVIQEQKKDVVEDIIAGITQTEQHVRNLPTPQEAKELQRGYLALFRSLRELFADLYDIERDPVKLMRDVRWGGDLIQEGARLERLRLSLVAQYNPQPSSSTTTETLPAKQ